MAFTVIETYQNNGEKLKQYRRNSELDILTLPKG
jgi:hypothetical protein